MRIELASGGAETRLKAGNTAGLDLEQLEGRRENKDDEGDAPLGRITEDKCHRSMQHVAESTGFDGREVQGLGLRECPPQENIGL